MNVIMKYMKDNKSWKKQSHVTKLHNVKNKSWKFKENIIEIMTMSDFAK